MTVDTRWDVLHNMAWYPSSSWPPPPLALWSQDTAPCPSRGIPARCKTLWGCHVAFVKTTTQLHNNVISPITFVIWRSSSDRLLIVVIIPLCTCRTVLCIRHIYNWGPRAHKGLLTIRDFFINCTFSSFADLLVEFDLPKTHLFCFFQIRHFLAKTNF